MRLQRHKLLVPLGLLTLALTGCPDKRPGTTAIFANRVKAKPASQPVGHSNAPHAPFANKNKGAPVEVEKGQGLALALTGHNSLEQLKIEAAGLPGELHESFERGYRLTFAADRKDRNPREAREIFESILSKHGNFGPAYRGVAYTFVDDNFQMNKAIEWYRKAVVAAPDYGLAHYGLAFMLGAMGQTNEGFKHFQQALKLGVKDERNLKSQFFKDMNEGIATH